MKIFEAKAFKRKYSARIRQNKLLRAQYRDFEVALLANPDDPVLRKHHLKGSMQGLIAFSVSDDLRVICKQVQNGYVFLDIGTHKEV